MDRSSLASRYALNDPVNLMDIRAAEARDGLSLPAEYVAFLQLTDGLYTGDRLVLLELSEIAGRNHDYDVQVWLPGFVMIGDDSGGTAVLMRGEDAKVYEVGMGVMDRASMCMSAPSLTALLIDMEGRTLSERGAIDLQ